MSYEADLLDLARELDEHLSGFAEALLDASDPSEAWKGEANTEKSAHHLEGYNDVRRRLRLLVGDTSVLKLPGREHERERWLLQQVLLGESAIDRILRNMDIRNPLHFTDEELEPIVQEYLSWFSYLEYAQAKLVGAVLVMNAGELPADLMHFVAEIQECFAFQRYTAVCALCRTALEAGLLRLYQTNELDHRDSVNSVIVRAQVEKHVDKRERKALSTQSNLYFSGTLDDKRPSIYQMSERLCWLPAYRNAKSNGEPLLDVLDRVRKQGNDLIHAKWIGNHKAAKTLMHDLFRCLHTLYEVEPHAAEPNT